ncbi:Hpt domain-containing protein [Pikeienuella piscinae]|uniref:Hpt domain-containing protein n=1 Tax=Pikeienuella piscinae TaxID=2748098 RepID=A0A7L5C2D2_9RHOB|nr:Hpt domain-containing protein [Pikeienuella piscinae]QIE56696.1 Hpt domain-containing protein [Pikeienuella piscinae]
MSGDRAEGVSRLKEKLLELRWAYMAGMPRRLERLCALWTDYEATGGEAGLDEILRETHKIAGTATMYGLADLGSIAREIEDRLLDLQRDGAQVVPDELSAAMARFLNWRSED